MAWTFSIVATENIKKMKELSDLQYKNADNFFLLIIILSFSEDDFGGTVRHRRCDGIRTGDREGPRRDPGQAAGREPDQPRVPGQTFEVRRHFGVK